MGPSEPGRVVGFRDTSGKGLLQEHSFVRGPPSAGNPDRR